MGGVAAGFVVFYNIIKTGLHSEIVRRITGQAIQLKVFETMGGMGAEPIVAVTGDSLVERRILIDMGKRVLFGSVFAQILRIGFGHFLGQGKHLRFFFR